MFDRLVAAFGEGNVFKDVDSIPLGSDFAQVIAEQLKDCNVVIVVIGRFWLTVRGQDKTPRLQDPADYVRIEIEQALNSRALVVPALIGNVAMPGEAELPDPIRRLARKNAISIRPDPDFHRDMDRLVRSIQEHFNRKDLASPSPVPPKQRSGLATPPNTARVVEAQLAFPREFTNSIGMRFVLIPAGKFLMGSPDDEEGREYGWGGEGPLHEVAITRPFYLGIHPVTQEQYEKVMGNNPSYFSAEGRGKDKVRGLDTRSFPVEQVSWEEAQTFLQQLAARKEEKEKTRQYHLPTEAEWEYSCRGGHPSHMFHFGNTLTPRQANYDNIIGRTSEVGSYPANAFGLFDMHGNVWEWCQDWYKGDYYQNSPRQDPTGPSEGQYLYRRGVIWNLFSPPVDPPGPSNGMGRVLRGGGWHSIGQCCRSAFRTGCFPTDRSYYLGFRAAVVLSGE
jgi:formylglycine-generating enzyme required for sulfatase activity